ncbi:MAG: 3'-5' exonuclease [Prolixibacteraceae bacterium]|nr:3'-5' exonuclease [Prolixibacteraceae bacterium]
MQLNLKNPIIFFDLEATGLNIVTDRIIEIGMIKIKPDNTEEVKEKRINPEMHIPEESSKIHGIYDNDVKDEPTFKQVAKSIAQFIEGCDITGFNSNHFDIPMLAEEFLRAGVDIDMKKHKFIDVQSIFHKMEKRTLTAAVKFYCHKTLEGAHGAMADTRATYDVLKAQLDLYKDIDYEDNDGKITKPVKNDMAALSEFSSFNDGVDFANRIVFNDKGEEVFNFGKNKGIPVEKVLKEQPGYYGWIMKSEFPLYTKKVLTAIKLKMR